VDTHNGGFSGSGRGGSRAPERLTAKTFARASCRIRPLPRARRGTGPRSPAGQRPLAGQAVPVGPDEPPTNEAAVTAGQKRPLTGRADPSRGTAVRAYTRSLAGVLGIRPPVTGLVDERAWTDVWDIAGAVPHTGPSLLSGLAAQATRLPRTRRITFPGLRYADARWLAWYLHGDLDTDFPVPGLRFLPGDIPFAPGVLSGAERGRRLARRKQTGLDITFTSDPGELEALHGEIEKVRLANGHGAAFTDEAYAACWQEVYGRLTCGGRLEAGTLRLDGQLAAYILAIPGQRVYRVAAGHHDPAFDPYRPGRLLEVKTVLQARDRGFLLVDWTSPVAPESLVAANWAQPRWSVTMGIA
jgi:hypothetical protein